LYATPLYGTGSSALGCVLEVCGARLLLDCGWDAAGGGAGTRAALARALEGGALDAVLLSSASRDACGGLPLLARALRDAGGLPAPRVYATPPVHRLGHLALYDAALSAAGGEDGGGGGGGGCDDPDAPSLDDIDAAFRLASQGGRFFTVRYRERVAVAGVRLSAVAAGGSLGAAAWEAVADAGGDSALYAVRVNLRAERHLPKLLPTQLSR
jgi:Cft2 family RNA processing exonuclease